MSRVSSVVRRSAPLIGAFAVGAIAYGGLYAFPALSVALADEFGASRTLAVTPWTMFLVVTALSAPLLGRAFDVFLDRHLLALGMVLLAGGWALVAVAPDLGAIILAYAVLLALGLEIAFIGISTAVARRYAGVSGLALGVAYAGPGIGVALSIPLAAAFVESAGWRVVALGFGALSLAGLLFVLLMTSGPAIVVPAGPRRGREPLHETSAPGAVGAAQEPLPAGSRDHRGSVRRTVRTRRFLVLFLGAVGIGAFDEGVLQAFLPHATEGGMRASLAAQALGIQSLAYVAGQVIGGALSDRFGRRAVGMGAAGVVVAGVVAAFGASAAQPGLAIAGIAAHGFGTGATIAVRSAAFSDVFGGKSFGTIFGILAIAYPVGGTISVFLGAVFFDRLGTYLPLVVLVVVAVAAWAVALWVAGPRRHGAAARRAG